MRFNDIETSSSNNTLLRLIVDKVQWVLWELKLEFDWQQQSCLRRAVPRVRL